MSDEEEIKFDLFNKNIKPFFYFIYSTTWFITILVGLFFIYVFPSLSSWELPVLNLLGWGLIIIGCGLLILDLITLILWSIFKYICKSEIPAKKSLTMAFGINFLVFISIFLFFMLFMAAFD